MLKRSLMEDAHTEARHTLQRFASAWLDGSHAAVAEGCRPTVRWWSPLAPERLDGAEALSTHLDALLRDVARPVAITALVVNDEGTRGVVEMISAATDTSASTALTSVVELSGGKVADGRTYVDVTAHPSLDRAGS
jgi:hypothetical protein